MLSSFLAIRDSLANEESLLVDALITVIESRMSTPENVSAMRVLMREVFPSSVCVRTSRSGRSVMLTSDALHDAIITQLHVSCLQAADSVVSKVRTSDSIHQQQRTRFTALNPGQSYISYSTRIITVTVTLSILTAIFPMDLS